MSVAATVTFNDKWHGFFSAIWHSQGDPDHRNAGRVPSCFDRVGELLLDVGVLRVIAVSLSGRGLFTSRRIIDGLCDNLRALAEHIWGVTYSAV
jgi:hypothetical protein